MNTIILGLWVMSPAIKATWGSRCVMHMNTFDCSVNTSRFSRRVRGFQHQNWDINRSHRRHALKTKCRCNIQYIVERIWRIPYPWLGLCPSMPKCYPSVWRPLPKQEKLRSLFKNVSNVPMGWWPMWHQRFLIWSLVWYNTVKYTRSSIVQTPRSGNIATTEHIVRKLMSASGCLDTHAACRLVMGSAWSAKWTIWTIVIEWTFTWKIWEVSLQIVWVKAIV